MTAPATAKNEAPSKPSETRAYWTHGVKDRAVTVSRLSQLVDDAPLSEPAKRVYRFLLNWYMREHGDALASIRHVIKVMKQRAPDGAKLLTRSAIHRGVIELLESGWVVRTYRAQARKKGGGGSRYVPIQYEALKLAANGKFPEPSHLVGQFEDDNDCPTSRDGYEKTVPPVGTDIAETVPPSGTKTRLLDPGTLDPETSISNVSAAPPTDGLSATASAAGFEKIWKAYGKLGDKKASRAAWEAIDNPDDEHIASRAASWAASAKSGQRRMPLEKWLAAEKYDEADRKVAEKPRSAISKPLANDDEPMEWVGDISSLVPPGRHMIEITRAEEVRDEHGTKLTVIMDIDTGRLVHGDVEHCFYTEHRNAKLQGAGQAHLAQITRAAAIVDIDSAGELIGLRSGAVIGQDGSIRYEPLADNDENRRAA